MFRKIVTELTYSPALAGSLGHYIRQLRNDISRRQIGLVFLFLAITIQIFATTFPPDSANENNPAVFIDGGIESIDDYLDYYDQNAGNIRDLMNSLGITRSEIKDSKLTKTLSKNPIFLWSTQNPREDDSYAYFFTTSNTTRRVAFYSPTTLSDQDSAIYSGTSSKFGGKFAITKDGASLITENRPASDCQAWLSSPKTSLRISSWVSPDEDECLSMVEAGLSARRVSSESREVGTLNTSNRIAYTISIKNKSDQKIKITPVVNLEDALEYTRILDYGSGEYNFDSRNLSWSTATLNSGGSLKRTFILQVPPTIPATPRGRYVTKSYDCTVSLSLASDTASSPVDCPLTKRVEQLTSTLPDVSTTLNILASSLAVVISLFLYARSRQLLNELHIIRHNHTGGL